MKNPIGFFVMFLSLAPMIAQAYDTSTLVDSNTNTTSNSTSVNTNNNNNNTTVDSTATNTNYNYGTVTNNNNNTTNSTSTSTNTSTNDNTNTNYNYGNVTTNSNVKNDTNSTNVNTNINDSRVDSRNDNFNDSRIKQKIESPPPTAIAPPMMSGGNNDLCTTGISGAVQTQVLGISGGGTVRDVNCERLKLSKYLYDMGMKVAAVSALCQDKRVFDAMMNAGTPCPYEGMIGDKAKVAWEENKDRIPKEEKNDSSSVVKKTGFAAILGTLLFFVL
jgi:hypothetical protein